MAQQRWDAVDDYFSSRLIGTDPVLEAALADSDTAGLPTIAVTGSQGRMLNLLARMCGARRILELGTLGGYSTIWLARALPADGRLTTLEVSAAHAQVARSNLARAGLTEQVEVRVGPAVDALAALADGPPYDLIFLDADKRSYPDYLQACLSVSRPGTVLVADNVVRGGAVVDADSADVAVQGVRRFTDLIAAEPRLTATAIQTVGSKGYDGFLLAVVTD